MAFKDADKRREYAREYNKRWRKANPELARARDVHYRLKYEGKHSRAYHERNKDERNADSLKRWHSNNERYRRTKYSVPTVRKIPEVCEGCGDTFESVSKACFDHDHQTGRFRGWLCNDCNISLGRMREDGDRLRRLAKYADLHMLLK